MEHVYNVTRYKSGYQTLVIDTPITSKIEMSKAIIEFMLMSSEEIVDISIKCSRIG